MDNNNPIDAVITWVDGNDPLHQKKIEKILSLEENKRLYVGSSKYKQIGEIYFCVLSIIKFAPFVRNIFFVTDSHVPGFVKKRNLNDHRVTASMERLRLAAVHHPLPVNAIYISHFRVRPQQFGDLHNLLIIT